MNNWKKRFAVMAVLGAMLSSVMLAGCPNEEPEEEAPAMEGDAPAPEGEEE